MNKKISGAGFHHIALKANDFEKSLEFYKNLGFELIYTWGEGTKSGAMLDIGDGGFVELFAGGTDQEALGRFFHLAIKTDDVDAAFKTALEAGARPKSEPKVLELQSSPRKYKIQIAFVYGPDDEEIEFFKNLD